MKKYSLLLITISMLIFTSNVTNAQFRMSVGPSLGLNFNIHTGSDIDEGGTGFGLLFAGQVDMSFNQNRSLGLITSIVFYDNRSGSSSQFGNYEGTNYNLDNDVSLAYFQLSTLFKYRLPNVGVYFVFGPELGFDLNADLEQEYTFPQNPTAAPQKVKSSLKNVNSRFELKMGTGYDIQLSKLITLAPQFTFGYGISDVIEDVDYNVLTFQALVTCKFNII